MKKIKRGLIIFILFVIGFIGIVEYVSFQIVNQMPEPNAAYVIVFGAKANDDKPSVVFKSRLDKAIFYLKQNPNTKVIVSGGQGFDENYPEGLVGKWYLMSHGIDEQRIISEETSTNTFENLVYSKKLMNDPTSHVVMVSSEFHMFRIRMLANRLDFNASYLASKTDIQHLLWAKPREYVAIIKSFLFDK